MTNRTSPPYSSKQELKATRAPAIVAFLLVILMVVTLAVMLTLAIVGAAEIHATAYLSVFFGGLLAVILTVAVGSRKRRGRARDTEGGER